MVIIINRKDICQKPTNKIDKENGENKESEKITAEGIMEGLDLLTKKPEMEDFLDKLITKDH